MNETELADALGNLGLHLKGSSRDLARVLLTHFKVESSDQSEEHFNNLLNCIRHTMSSYRGMSRTEYGSRATKADITFAGDPHVYVLSLELKNPLTG